MKHAPVLVATMLVAAGLSTPARADIYIVHRTGATIVPAKSEDISMDAEDVRIERYEYGYIATVTFVMRNHAGRQVDSLVAFPILGSTLGRPSNFDQDFQVHIKDHGEPDGAYQRVIAQIQPGRARTDQDDPLPTNPPKVVGDYPEAVTWNVTWQPRQTKIIRVRFDMGEAMGLPGSNSLIYCWQLMYVVTTGSLWKGPIGRADISIRFTDPAMTIKGWTALERFRQVSYPDHARWEGSDLVAWHFENWTPTEEIWVKSAQWRGLRAEDVPQRLFQLPYPYQGAARDYEEALIESLVARDLKLARECFPGEVEALDVNLLRISIADWLLHEIYARHGDTFYLGKASALPESIHGWVQGEDGDAYSLWASNFPLEFRGGWYNPDYSPQAAVKFSALLPIEQKNVRFLRAYLDKLRSEPKYRDLRATAHTPGIE